MAIMEPARPDTSATLTVNEIYKSIQGESTWAGLPCVLVRLTGCHLRCSWCDTEYAFHDGQKLTIADILREVEAMDCPLAEITGGEPLLQKNCAVLAQALLDAGKTVLCETSGALPIDALPEGVIRIMDLKCPGSGESEKNDWSNIEKLTSRDEVKFVIQDRADYEWSREAVGTYTLATRCKAVLFSPVFGAVEPRELAAWILEDNLPVHFQLQLHKLVWPAAERGV